MTAPTKDRKKTSQTKEGTTEEVEVDDRRRVRYVARKISIKSPLPFDQTKTVSQSSGYMQATAN